MNKKLFIVIAALFCVASVYAQSTAKSSSAAKASASVAKTSAASAASSHASAATSAASAEASASQVTSAGTTLEANGLLSAQVCAILAVFAASFLAMLS